MHRRPPPPRRADRPASSAVELAIVLPLLGLLLLITVDFARLYYCYTIVTNCARNGALYASDPTTAAESPYGSVTEAAQADAATANNANNGLDSLPTVTSSNGTDSSGNPYVEVTVVYPFATLSNYPGLPNPIQLTRTVQMRVAPAAPN